MSIKWSLSLLFLATACGGFQLFQPFHEVSPKRGPSSIAEEQLEQELEQQLVSLHHYHVIAQKQLEVFDESLASTPLESLYDSPAYLKLQAARAQMEEIEHEVHENIDTLDKEPEKRKGIRKRLLEKLQRFAEKSQSQSLALENLGHKLRLKVKRIWKRPISKKELHKEYDQLLTSTQFQVHEKNIEHLSYMLEAAQDEGQKKFFPSTGKPGNIVGSEFPSKVWSLTFDDGPKAATTPIILENLKKHGLKATFFQLTSAAKANPQINKELREAGMEIASHSYTHQQLTKVSGKSLDKEITTAARELSELHQRPIKFFRLPYGAGVNNSEIREKIAASKMIHVFWNIDTLDWMAQPPEKIVERTLALMKKTPKDAGVLLFHDIHMRTAEATPKIMEYLKQESRRVCTLEEIVDQMNKGDATVCPPQK